ncbi:MAG: hypothetical protein GX927_01180 [Lentisphaerae bacterium]|nr:hypothetical protein [Lentisphaerota bacterium]
MSYSKLTLFVVFISGLFLWSASEKQAISLPYQSTAPVIDGDLSDDCWQSLPWHSGFLYHRTLQAAEKDTRFRMFHDGYHLFVAVEAFEPLPEKLRREKYPFDSSIIWMNDSIEFFICTDPLKRSFHQIIIDAAGQRYDTRYEDNNAGGYKGNATWDSGAEVGCAAGDDRWCIELALPLALLNASAPELSFNLVRNRNSVSPRQLSSFAANSESKNARPEIFLPLLPEQWQADVYAFAVNLIGTEYKRLDGNHFVADVSVHASSRSDRFRILRQHLRLLNLQGELVAEQENKIEVPAGKFTELLVKLQNVDAGTYLLDIRLYDNLSARNLLAGVREKILLEYAPFSIRLINPPYRNAIFASMPEQNIEAAIDFKDFLGKPLTVTLSGKDGKVDEFHIAAAQATQTVQFQAKDLPIGDYRLSASVGGLDFKPEIVLPIRKLKALKGEVWVDREGITHVDGKRFFPFGWYGHDDSDAPKPHLNSVLDTSLYSTREGLLQAFDRRQQLGEKMMLFPYQEFNANWGSKVFATKNRSGGLTPEQRELLTAFIPTIREHPALLGYYMADEPEAHDDNPRWYLEVYELLRELDPWHPCFMLNYGLYGIRRFYQTCDILLPDCYPTYFEDGSTGKPRHCSSEWAMAATALRPSWFMPLVASWPARNRRNVRGVPPNYDELRSQFFQALIHNVKGFNLYAYFESQRFASLILGPDDIGKTLQTLQDFLLPNSRQQALKVTTKPESEFFQAGFKMEGDKQCLLAVNTEMRPIKATFVIQEPVADKLYVAGEKRFVKLNRGVFSDTFLPGETHVYVNSEAAAAAVPMVEGTRQAIDALRRSRKKPGNLIGMGEMLVADYLDYSAGKLPPGVPKIEASSDPKSFFATAKTGSRYYLIDGLTAPKRVEYTWSPAKSDQSPFIEITLPEAATLRELVLYTPSGNLRSGSVDVADRRIDFTRPQTEVADREVVKISVPLPEIVADKIRIDFKDFDIDFHTQRPERRLLSEIELY